LPTINARWPIKDSKVADFRPVYFKDKKSELQFELSSQGFVTPSKNA